MAPTGSTWNPHNTLCPQPSSSALGSQTLPGLCWRCACLQPCLWPRLPGGHWTCVVALSPAALTGWAPTWFIPWLCLGLSMDPLSAHSSAETLWAVALVCEGTASAAFTPFLSFLCEVQAPDERAHPALSHHMPLFSTLSVLYLSSTFSPGHTFVCFVFYQA